MNASNHMHAVQISRVTTLLDHTDASVHWDLLQSLSLRIQTIQFVMVRNSAYSKPESLFSLVMCASPQVGNIV